MDKLKKLAEVHRSTIASASKRASEAEQIAKKLEPTVKEKTETEKDLQRRLELSRQLNQVLKSLAATLPKLNEAKTKLRIAIERSDTVDKRIQLLNAEAEGFEAKYETVKKEHKQMLLELEHIEFS